MQKYLLICNAYPTVEKVYANGFLHRRVKSYQRAGLDVDVIVITTKVLKDRFYDGVHIKYMDEYQIASHMKDNHYGTVLFHFINRSEEHTSELQSRFDLLCRLLLEKKKYKKLIY